MKGDEIAARREQVAQLLLAHYSVRAIADDIEVPKSTVHRDIQALRTEWQQLRMVAMDQAAAEELQRLEAAERAIWPAVLRGEFLAVDRLLKIMERRARLLGLDAPDRIEHLLAEGARQLAEEHGIEMDDVVAEATRILAGRS